MTELAASTRGRAGVVLDVDGTLADTEAVWDVVEEETILAHGGHPTPALIANFRGKPLPETARTLHAWLPRGIRPSVPALVRELTERFRAALLTDAIKPTRGAAELLRHLRTNAIPTAAVSNSPRHLVETTLRRTDLADLLGLVVCADDNPALQPKPAPDLYAFAAARLGIDPHLSWGLEDTRPGLLALRAAGFLPVVVQPDALPGNGATIVAAALWPLDTAWLFATAAARQGSHF